MHSIKLLLTCQTRRDTSAVKFRLFNDYAKDKIISFCLDFRSFYGKLQTACHQGSKLELSYSKVIVIKWASESFSWKWALKRMFTWLNDSRISATSSCERWESAMLKRQSSTTFNWPKNKEENNWKYGDSKIISLFFPQWAVPIRPTSLSTNNALLLVNTQWP